MKLGNWTRLGLMFFLTIGFLGIWSGKFTNAQQPSPPPSGPQTEIYVCPLHRDISSKAPGICSKCGKTLIAVKIGEDQDFFTCPMHPDVMSGSAGKCPKCQMTLVKMSAPETSDFDVKIETTPKLVVPGQPVHFRFTILHPRTGEQIKNFNILHEMPFHLFVVSRDFSHFDHIHPTLEKDGTFSIDTVLPKAGHYQIFCDFFPVGGLPQVLHKNLVTKGYTGDLISDQARITPDNPMVKIIDGMRFELKFDPATPIAGQPAILKYHVTDVATGKPISDFQPYLGAWGHTLILSEDAIDYLHSHPTQVVPEGVDLSKLVSRSDVDFDTFFPHPGKYRVWSQFQRGNKITTVSFNLNVPRMN